MSDQDQYQRELDVIEEVKDKGPAGKFFGYAKISGPGWLQGAITLGGGSLAGALYLGVIAGYGLMWLQPLAMVCGIIMLSAIAYVTLSTGKRPFGAINQHISPLLGWSWLIATVMANIVWCMPQFALGTEAVQENLIPSIGKSTGSTAVIVAILFAIGIYVNHLYQSPGRGSKIFGLIIKILVGLIILSFFAVVGTLTASGALPWGEIFKGFIPDPGALFRPSGTFTELINASPNSEFWEKHISDLQRDKIMAAFASAVGINMTWLLPYTLLKKRWGAKHRDLARVDLSIGLFVPFLLATSCLVMVSASQFHGQTKDILDQSNMPTAEKKEFYGTLSKVPSIKEAYPKLPADASKEEKEARAAGIEKMANALPLPDKQLSAMLVDRRNIQLASTLTPLAGEAVAQTIFGLGVVGMAISTIIILMLINGLAFQELLGKPDSRKVYFIGCLVSGIAGAMGPFFWGKASAALAVPTSVIGGSMLPIAYFTFLLLMNSKKVLGEHRPEGKSRIIWNVLMVFSTAIATFGSIWAIKGKAFGGFPAGKVGIAFLILLFAVGTVSFLKNERKA